MLIESVKFDSIIKRMFSRYVYVYIILIVIIIGVLFDFGWLVIQNNEIEVITQPQKLKNINTFLLPTSYFLPIESSNEDEQGREKIETSEKEELLMLSQNILLDVPFTSQAPFANWNDEIFQNACEEASIIMAMRWAKRNLSLIPKEKAQEEILAIVDFEQKNYGYFLDTSGADTAKLMKDYFNYQGVEFRSNIDANDIKAELEKGRVVIVPVNGQKLGNPFFKSPGPIEHMIVVIGYDVGTKKFIVNDPGTRHGEKFRYSEDILEMALQDYPSGFHEPILKINKVMIVVGS